MQRVLKYLQNELNNPRIRYKYDPVRITVGYETTIYKFKLINVSKIYSYPLVIRIFKEKGGRPEFETIIHNTLNNLGYPIPRVYFTCSDNEKTGMRFIVMEEVQGELLLNRDHDSILKIFTEAHLRLHKTPVKKILSALNASSLHPDEYSFQGRLDWLTRTIQENEYTSLYPGLDWLRDNLTKPSTLAHVVCHTDFHPGNILVKNGRVSGVLDWSGFMIGEPELDVGFTNILGTIAAPLIWPKIEWGKLVDEYFEEYQKKNPVDIDRVRYFEAFRLFQALMEGLSGHEAWKQPEIYSTLARIFEEKISL